MASTADGSDEPGTPRADLTLTTPELLEAILENLDLFELADARYVSSFWRDLIDTSPTLKKILFNNDEVWNDLQKTRNTSHSFATPSGAVHHLHSFSELSDSKLQTQSRPATAPLTIKLHPSLRHVNTWHPKSRFSDTDTFTFRFWERKLAVYPQKGLWRKQLICQPPVDMVHLHNTYHHFPNKWNHEEAFGDFPNPGGVTLGNLQDDVLATIDDQKEWQTTKKGRKLRIREATQHGTDSHLDNWKGIDAMKPGDREELKPAKWEGKEIEEDGLTKRQRVKLLKKINFHGHAELPGIKPVTEYADA
ncbi:unnamed protein product [Cercospora beticola]|nr:unnamed protein product [Cercospora beticola]